MPSPFFRVLACLSLIGCSSSVSGEWDITSVTVGSGAEATSLPDLDGTLVIEGDGTATLDLVSGEADTDSDFVVISVEGESVDGNGDEFSLVMTGFQEEFQNAIFIDLTLDCVQSEDDDAVCSGLWESTGLDSQDISFDLAAQ